jgi:hypothetical protein
MNQAHTDRGSLRNSITVRDIAFAAQRGVLIHHPGADPLRERKLGPALDYLR